VIEEDDVLLPHVALRRPAPRSVRRRALRANRHKAVIARSRELTGRWRGGRSWSGSLTSRRRWGAIDPGPRNESSRVQPAARRRAVGFPHL